LPFRDAEQHLRDILESINSIETFLGDMDFDVYRGDLKTKSAVERQLQIITEASVRLGEDGDRLCPGVDWKGFRGMGNVLRHGYHRIDDKVVWDTVKDELPPVKSAVLRALNPPPASPRAPTQH
jgi:uncharacterized protein with HEPN domain